MSAPLLSVNQSGVAATAALSCSLIQSRLTQGLGTHDIGSLESVATSVRHAIQDTSAWSHAASYEFPGFEFGARVAAMPIPERQELLQVLKRAVVASGTTVAIQDRDAAKAMAVAFTNARKGVNKYMLHGGSASTVLVGTLRTEDLAKVIIEALRTKDLPSSFPAFLREHWTHVLEGALRAERQDVHVPYANYAIDVHFANGCQLVVHDISLSAPLLHSQRVKLCREIASRILTACAPAAGEPSVSVVLGVRDMSSSMFDLFHDQVSDVNGIKSLNIDNPRLTRPLPAQHS